MSTPNQDNLVAKNKAYAEKFDQGHLAAPPGKKYAIVTCMDARIDTSSAFGIDLGDAHVMRNAGGSARDALRSLVISEQLLGTTEIMVIKHTKCGMATFKNEDARGVVGKNLGQEAEHECKDLDFLPFADLNESVKDDVSFLKQSKLIPNTVSISGWVYDVESGKTSKVV
ncbi:MAG: hypothetical protein M1835_006640 [Candelina submexicana]|nr:MAG: hypothetical protein M1835_006640 [Candelina submexicana]